MAASTQKALAQLRVLDLTRVRAGPTCCRILADFGADVIKIEAPDGVDPNEGMSGARDGYDMLNLHRNKRSIKLNLNKPEGLAVFLDLVKTADVVVENYRPDVKERLGFGYEVLRQVNPRIILCSISGFGEDGPYRHRAGFDQIAQGMGGLMWITGLPEQGPVRAGIAVADSSAGIYAANGILRCWNARNRGRGNGSKPRCCRRRLPCVISKPHAGWSITACPRKRAMIILIRHPWACCPRKTAISISVSAATANGALCAMPWGARIGNRIRAFSPRMIALPTGPH